MAEVTRTTEENPALDNPVTLNPVVGITMDDLADAAKTVAKQALLQPGIAAEQLGRLAQEWVKITLGESKLDPLPKDKRFRDEAWSANPLFRSMKQGWLAWHRTLNEWVDRCDFDPADRERARFIVNLLADAAAPTNFLATNPSAQRRAVETRGASLAKGFRNFVDDMVNNHQMPAQVDKSKFKVGENLAITPGQVVFRNELIELLQYAPTTDEVTARPVFIVPPQINKYYLFDLSPQKSVIKHLVDSGLQVFVISWRNPTSEHRDWGLDDYVMAVDEALDACLEITGQASVNSVGACAGGITLALALGYWAAHNVDKVNSLTLLVNVLSFEDQDSLMTLFSNEQTIDRSRKRSARQGVLDGFETAKVFNWMRPNDLIWNYVVSNYLHGEAPPTFDILYWNNDCTRLPARLHSDFLDLFGTTTLANQGSVAVCDTPVDLKQVHCDVFVTGGTTDHITPWQACYRSTQMFGGDVEYVLSSAGHIQSVLNPPGNPKAVFWTNDEIPEDPEVWRAGATEHKGSWWPYWVEWLRDRGGESVSAPATLGSEAHPALLEAPGRYVFE